MIFTKALKMLALIVLAFVITCGAAMAESTTHTLYGALGTFSLVCDTTFTNGVWIYSYTLNFIQGEAEAASFSVGNPNLVYFWDAANTASPENQFINPTYNPAFESVRWYDGYMEEGDVVTFSYKSYNAPMDIPVYCYAKDGGRIATGYTRGMGEIIPEPSSFAAMGMALVGFIPLMRRRK